MQNVVIVGRTLSVLDVLGKWDTALRARQAEVEAIHAAQPDVRVSFIEVDPLLEEPKELNHPAIIHSLAANLIELLSSYTLHPQHGAEVMDAVAAWRLVLRTRDHDDLAQRIDIARKRTAKVFPRIDKLARHT